MRRRSLLGGCIAALAFAAAAHADPSISRSVALWGDSNGRAPFASVNADGWSVKFNGGPPNALSALTLPMPYKVYRKGYDGLGNATTYMEWMHVTQGVRTVATASPFTPATSALTAANDEFIYADDVFSGGAANNSALASPKPIANWAYPDRRMVGNTLHLEVVAFHRNARQGKQVACVVFTATDGAGGHSATQTVSTPTILGHSGDKMPIIGYAADLNISGFSDPATVTANAVVYPWIGSSSASIADSSTGTANSREFCTQTYRRNTTRFASPVYARVNKTTGVDENVVNATGFGSTTGVKKLSTTWTDLTAGANNSFKTIQGAQFAMNTCTGVMGAGSLLDGCIIRVGSEGADIISGMPGGTYQSVAHYYIECDPANTPAQCVITVGSASNNLQLDIGVWLRNISITRTGGFGFGATPSGNGGRVVFENVLMNNASNTGYIVQTGLGHCYVMGMTITNGASATLGGTATNQERMTRGVDGGAGTTAATSFLSLGNKFTNLGWSVSSQGENNQIIAFNQNMKCTTSIWSISQATATSQVAFCQNVIEYLSASSNPIIRPSADSTTDTSVTHLVMHNNTFAGGGGLGRFNILYDTTVGSPRTHKLNSIKGNIPVSIYTKNDWFVCDDNGGTPNPTDAPNHTGNWSYTYGVACHWNYIQYVGNDVIGTIQAQAYAGLGSVPGIATPGNLPLFTSNKAVTAAGSIAAGGNGDYTLQGGSPCKGMITDALLAFDLAGTPRSVTADSAGAYA